jgi:hypothetical protein
MKAIFKNIITVYFLRLAASLLTYPIISAIGRYCIKDDIRHFEYFNLGPIWFYFIYQVVVSLIWAICFYIISILMSFKIELIYKLILLCMVLSFIETVVEYQHEIIKNKTFFLVEIHSVHFIRQQIVNFPIIILFICLYTLLHNKMIKRPTILP